MTFSGRVAFPGEYDFRPTETLTDLLQIANAAGDFRADAGDTIRLMRFSMNPLG